MHIRDLFKQKKFTLSFEVFPPTREGNLENLFVTIKELSDLKPDFISVTYGAGAAHGKRLWKSPPGLKGL